MVTTQNVAYINGIAYNDSNMDGSYTRGEGVAGLKVAVGSGAVFSAVEGSYSRSVFAGDITATLSGAGIVSPVTVKTFVTNEDMTLDVVNGNALVTSNSLSVSGPISEIRVAGTKGLQIGAGAGNQTIIGGAGSDTLNGGEGSDILLGGLGNDLLDGGTGIDVAWFSGNSSEYTLSSGVNGPVVNHATGGSDTLRSIEVLRFQDGEFIYSNAKGGLVAFPDGAGPQTSFLKVPATPVETGAIFAIEGRAYNDLNRDGVYTQGEGVSGVKIQVGTGSVFSMANGDYSRSVFAGLVKANLTFDGLPTPIAIETWVTDQNTRLDLVNGNTLITNNSLKVSGSISEVRIAGSKGLEIIGDEGNQTIIGGIGNDVLWGQAGSDILKGGAGNDYLHGGNGLDIAVFEGRSSQYSFNVAGAGVTVAGAGEGVDTATGVEIYRFSDGEFIFDASSRTLIRFGETNWQTTPPVVDPGQTSSTNEDTPVDIAVQISGQALSFSASGAAHGTVTHTGSGVFRYTPSANYSGSDSFVVSVADSFGRISTQAVTVQVKPVNDAPLVPTSTPAVASENTPVAIKIPATDADGDQLTYTATRLPNGTLSGGADGTFIYTPRPGFVGTDSFVVSVGDGNGGSATTQVNVTVSPPADPATGVKVITATGFAGSIGGTGMVVGTNGFQDITLVDAAGTVAFDPSYNRGGDVVRLPNAVGSYTINTAGSSVKISDGDTTYIFPIGEAGLALAFPDGVRTLIYDSSAQAVNIGSQSVTATASVITAATEGTGIPAGHEADATARIALPANGQVTAGGDYLVLGTSSGAETINYLSGDMVLDPSFNRGGDTLGLPRDVEEYSAYVSGSSLVLLSQDGSLTIPLGVTGMRLTFAGEERLLVYDQASSSVLIGDEEITASTRGDAQQLGSVDGYSLDIGDGGDAVIMSLENGISYLLLDDAREDSNVTITGFDEGDLISVAGAFAGDYSFGTVAGDPDDLQITFNSGSATNIIVIEDIVPAAAGIIFDEASAEAQVGYNFIDFG